MSLTLAQELIIRRALADKIATVAAVGYVIPSPIVFSGKEEFWSTVNGSAVNTQKLIDQSPIKACWISFLGFLDSSQYGCEEEPQIKLSYRLDLFHQYEFTRVDETATPDEFNARLLLSHNEFVGALLDLRSEFLGRRNIAGLDPAEFEVKETTSLVQTENVKNNDFCEYIPGIKGHQIKLQEGLNILLAG